MVLNMCRMCIYVPISARLGVAVGGLSGYEFEEPQETTINNDILLCVVWGLLMMSIGLCHLRSDGTLCFVVSSVSFDLKGGESLDLRGVWPGDFSARLSSMR